MITDERFDHVPTRICIPNTSKNDTYLLHLNLLQIITILRKRKRMD